MEEVADFAFVLGKHSFQDCAAGAGTARDKDLFVDGGSGGYYVRLLGQFVEEWTPIADAVALYSEKADVGG